MEVIGPIRLLSHSRSFHGNSNYVYDRVRFFHSNLNGVKFNIIQVPIDEITNYRPIIEIESIKEANIAFLSIGLEKNKFDVIKNRAVSSKGRVRLDIRGDTEFYIGINSFDNWLLEQKILSDCQKYNTIQTNKCMQSSCDVKFHLKSDSEIEYVQAHSIVLNMKCQYFLKMFESEMSEEVTKVIEMDISKPALIAILQYIYTGEMDKTIFIKDNYSTILEIYQKICEFEINELIPMLENFILGYLDKGNLDLLNDSGILNYKSLFGRLAISFMLTVCES